MQVRSRTELGALIRDRRRNDGLTQASLAVKVGISAHSVIDIESGKGNPTIDIVFRCLAALGARISVEDVADSEAASEALLSKIIDSHTIRETR